MRSEFSDRANEYAEAETNRDLYPEPMLEHLPTLEDYDRQRRWLTYYCQKRVEFFSLSSRVYEGEPKDKNI